uniref:Ig-like domain-containing protein n=1 Tax=Amphilophus citrinellus TaxID=61819 RepID=A0A3Q0T017_AMPCI
MFLFLLCFFTPAPPTIKGTTEASEVSVVLGFPAVLPCDVEGSPTPSITWLKDNQPIVSTPQLTYTRGGQALRLGSAQGDSSAFWVRLFSISSVPPQIEGDSTAITLGSHVALLCEATGVPVPSITWLKDGTPIESSLQWQWSVRGNRLELGPLSLSHAGTYTCVAKNSEGQAQKEYTVTVQGNEFSLHVMSAPSGEELTLECRANGIPTPRLSWLKDGVTLEGSDTRHIT